MPRAFSIAKLTRTFDRIHALIEAGLSGAPGLRRFEGWAVADGEPAAREAINLYLQQGGTAPPEITMTAHLVALYGAQIAVSNMGVMLFLPQGFPPHIIRVGEAAGFQPERAPGRSYQLLRWTA